MDIQQLRTDFPSGNAQRDAQTINALLETQINRALNNTFGYISV